jgi:hypothetical protein
MPRRDAVLRSLFFWHHRTSDAERSKAGIGFYVLTFGLLTARSLARRRALAALAMMASALTLACGASLMTAHWQERNEPAAVVTAMDVVVYKGPGPGYQRQFEQPLQPGVECVVHERRDRWWRIELADRNAGWIEASAAELVREEPLADRSIDLQ